MKHKNLIILCVIGALFLMVGCAYAQDKTFTLNLNGKPVTVLLPDGLLPSMSETVLAGEKCFNAKVCIQRFCLTLKPGHDHLDFVFIGNEVIALVWIKELEMERDKRFMAWIYVEGKPISAPIDVVIELVRKHDPNA